jgi:hypothetical protein
MWLIFSEVDVNPQQPKHPVLRPAILNGLALEKPKNEAASFYSREKAQFKLALTPLFNARYLRGGFFRPSPIGLF